MRASNKDLLSLHKMMAIEALLTLMDVQVKTHSMADTSSS